MDSIYSAALMTESQKKHITLRVDEDGTDLEQFKQLAEIEKNILNFVPMNYNIQQQNVFKETFFRRLLK